MKLVRRARKSIRERRMKACMRDLSSNLERVEMRVYKQQKQQRQQQRKRAGGLLPDTSVPRDVLQGKMNAELHAIECRLHREAGLPPPPPLHLQMQADRQGSTQRPDTRCIGFVEFAAIARHLQRNSHPHYGS